MGANRHWGAGFLAERSGFHKRRLFKVLQAPEEGRYRGVCSVCRGSIARTGFWGMTEQKRSTGVGFRVGLG